MICCFQNASFKPASAGRRYANPNLKRRDQMKKIVSAAVVMFFLCAGLCSLSYAKDLVWEGNSKAMYDKTIDMSPDFAKEQASKKLMDAIVAKAGESGKVSEEIALQCIKETTPSFVVDQTMKEVEALRSKPAQK